LGVGSWELGVGSWELLHWRKSGLCSWAHRLLESDYRSSLIVYHLLLTASILIRNHGLGLEVLLITNS
jgi:hypothetical protein